MAASFEAKESYDRKLFGFHNVLARMLNLDVGVMWRPTAENYFLGNQKSGLLTLLHQLGGDHLSSRYAASEKSEIAEALEKICSGQAIVEPEVRERALAWLPNTMRFDAATDTTGGHDPLDEPGDDDGETGDDYSITDDGEPGGDDQDEDIHDGEDLHEDAAA